jgi:uncharacterized protein YjbI with pentapeptide repeats
MSVSPLARTLNNGKTLWQALQEHKNWRENNYDDVRTRLDLNGEDLKYIDFTGYDINGARFTDCSCQYSTLPAEMYDVLFKTCDMTDALFTRGKMQYVRFNRCTLVNAILRDVDFNACSDYMSDKTNTNFTSAEVSGYSILYLPSPFATEATLGLLANWTDTGVSVAFGSLMFGPMPQWRVVSSAPADMT